MRKRMTELAGKVRDKFRHGLMLQVMKNRLSRLGMDINLFYLTLEGTMNMSLPEIKGDTSAFSIEKLGPSDLLSICDQTEPHGREIFANIGYTFGIFQNYFDQGKRCLGVKHRGELIAFLWVDDHACIHKSVKILLKPGEVYFSDMYTMEEYRGRNIAAYLRYHTIELLKKEGKGTFYSFTDYFNTPAMKNKNKLHSKKLKLFLHLRLFNRFERDCILRTFN